MHRSAIAYNLKKYLKLDQKLVESGAGTHAFKVFVKKGCPKTVFNFTKASKIDFPILIRQEKSAVRRLV